MAATVIHLDDVTEARRALVTARAILRLTDAISVADRDPDYRAAAAAHAAELREQLPALIAACRPCPTCGKGQTVETLMTGCDQGPAEVWCSRCDQPSTTELTVTDGSTTYRAAYCGTCATNVTWAAQASANRARRNATR